MKAAPLGADELVAGIAEWATEYFVMGGDFDEEALFAAGVAARSAFRRGLCYEDAIQIGRQAYFAVLAKASTPG